jgi:hypothetical protein
VLLRSLGPEHATDELLGVGMAPFFYSPGIHAVDVIVNGAPTPAGSFLVTAGRRHRDF